MLSSKAALMLSSSSDKTSGIKFYLPVTIQQLAVFTVSLPLFGFVFCIVVSYIKNFENSTQTHCDVPNFAPSISAAIGSFVPQKYVWQACISLHATPRFFFAYLHFNHFSERLLRTRRNHRLIGTAAIVNVIENFGLLGLSLISSQERFEVHKFCFEVFISMSVVYMFLTYYMYTSTRCGFNPQNREEMKSLRYKKNILTVYLISVLFMVVFYVRHNEYCEPYVYSFFCVCEYVMVIANMCYHMTAYYDLKDVSAVIPNNFIRRRSSLSLEFPKQIV